jgi:hypothetical protein
MIFATINLNKLQKPGFGRKNQLKMWSHLQVMFNSSKIG